MIIPIHALDVTLIAFTCTCFHSPSQSLIFSICISFFFQNSHVMNKSRIADTRNLTDIQPLKLHKKFSFASFNNMVQQQNLNEKSLGHLGHSYIFLYGTILFISIEGSSSLEKFDYGS